jgi:hypothetical protein
MEQYAATCRGSHFAVRSFWTRMYLKVRRDRRGPRPPPNSDTGLTRI